MRRPKTRTTPLVGRIKPAISRSSTVLPEPLPPMIASVVSPCGTVSDTPLSTSLASNRLADVDQLDYRLVVGRGSGRGACPGGVDPITRTASGTAW